MKNRRTLVIISMCIALIVIACLLSACEKQHIHNFGEWQEIKEATCTDTGVNERYCSCGEKQTQTISAYKHNEITDLAITPTCTSDGKTEGKHCDRCNAILIASTTIKSTGHQYNNGEIITKATCNQSGTKKFTCLVENCLHSYTETYSLQTYTAEELYNVSIKYVGEIITYDKKGNELALGTGFVISSDGKIVTNYHVIEGAYSADITINNTKYNISSVLAYDTNIDLAILKVNATGLTAATICKKPVNVGSTVYAIGSSRGMTNTYSQGIITYADRIVDGVSHVQHDASITHGNSGGPLINVYGEVIGINTWEISDSQNLNFAVFADELDNLVYGTPITIAELTKLNISPYQMVVNWVCNNATDAYDDKMEYSMEWDENSWYTISYNRSDGGSLTISHLTITEQSTSWGAFKLKEGSAVVDCCYMHDWTETGTSMGEAYGTLSIATYNYGDRLTYTHYYGESFMEEGTGNLYHIVNVGNIEWLRVLLDATDLGITLIDLGFVSYEYP